MRYPAVRAHALMTSFKMSHLHPDNIFSIPKNLALYNNRNLARHYLRFAENAHRMTIEDDTGFNLAFLTTKVKDKTPHLYSKGKLIPGVMASGAFPGAFSPVDGLMDGDLSDLPIDQIEEILGFRPKEIIEARLESKNQITNLAKNILRVLRSDQTESDIQIRELVIKPDPNVIKGMRATDYDDVEKMDYLFNLAADTTEEFFKEQ